ncbi:hypothetical protein D7I39_11305 [Allopusillimonas ginsengisoli]|nr:hypothetical protein D7I39_11305 [Allopusillimonas ginsengisoli]
MATTFSMAYDNDPEGFQKRVEAQLHAQSIAIAAALALAAKHDIHKEVSLGHQQSRISEVDSKDRLLPINDRDKLYAMQHLSDIFAEARKILAVEFPSDNTKPSS